MVKAKASIDAIYKEIGFWCNVVSSIIAGVMTYLAAFNNDVISTELIAVIGIVGVITTVVSTAISKRLNPMI